MWRHGSFRIFGWATLVVAAFAAAPLAAAERHVSVASKSLQKTIAEAAPGDILRLGPGDHAGPIIIAKPITLIGERKTRIVGSGSGSVLTVDAAGVTVRGIEITGSGLKQETMDAGIRLTKRATGARIEDNRLIDNLIGVDVKGPRDVLIAGNTILGRSDLRMNDRGNGVYVWNSPGLVVEKNLFRFGRDGIFVNTSRNNTFRDNRFENLRFAVHYMYTNNGNITGNISIGNHIGYALMFSSKLTVRDNVSIGDRDHGIMLNYANSAKITGNVIRKGGTKCLFMYNANKNEISGNRFESCGIGVHFTAGSERNAIFENAFVANRTQVKYVGSRWLDWSAKGRGNYWSDHAAFDLNGDGIADSVYRPNDMIDHILWTQPSAKLLLGSPAMQILRWSQSQFPALLPGGVFDPAPLMRAPVSSKSIEGANG